ncbi:MAG: hypothetical protein MZV63_69790 [Marinilabiliales bacterium]|nr:hypothetical protein [Marinilabiliales bacterium]
MSNEETTIEQSQPQDSMSTNLPNLTKHMSFIGLLAMIGGVIYCITIIGAIIEYHIILWANDSGVG